MNLCQIVSRWSRFKGPADVQLALEEAGPSRIDRLMSDESSLTLDVGRELCDFRASGMDGMYAPRLAWMNMSCSDSLSVVAACDGSPSTPSIASSPSVTIEAAAGSLTASAVLTGAVLGSDCSGLGATAPAVCAMSLSKCGGCCTAISSELTKLEVSWY